MPIRKILQWCLLPALWLFLSGARAADINFLVMPEEVIGPISPYVYGLNDTDPLETHATVRRLGGNRLTGYNWVTNASNAGNDWHHVSDNWLCDDHHYTDCDQPGAFVRHFVEANQKAGMESLVTVQMAGYVSTDKKGEVSEKETAPSPRWKKVLPRKERAFSLTPDPDAPAVYVDEFVNFLTANYKKGLEGGVRFYDLDNEPALWPSTHPRIHPRKTGYWEMVNATELTALGILKVDPTAMIFGPVCYGWQEFLTLQDSPDAADINKQFGSFLDFYLDQMKYLESRDHQRLLHVLDLHWYPEAQGGGKRITEGDTSPESVEARLQAPRSLWDPGYVEKSWITQYSTKGQPITLIPWVKEKIDTRYPGTKLAFTEYDYGAGNHVSGGLAQADVLGIFGKNSVFMANYWGDLKPYNRAAFKIYRNYDGNGAAFGGTSVSAATEDVAQTSIYASTDPKTPGVLWVLVLNKNQKDAVHGKFKIQSNSEFAGYTCYGFDSHSPEIKAEKPGKLSNNQFDMNLPPLSATLFVCR